MLDTTQRDRRRQAFTLVELLVVMTIIGLLVAILLPAINAAREAARRAQCINKLRQLSIAVADFEATFGSYPLCSDSSVELLDDLHLPAYGINSTPIPRTRDRDASLQTVVRRSFSGYSWIVRSLPFIEEKSLYDQMKQVTDHMWAPAFHSQTVDSTGRHFAFRQVPFVRCPSFSGARFAQAKEYVEFTGLVGAGVESGSSLVAAGNYVCFPGTHIQRSILATSQPSASGCPPLPVHIQPSPFILEELNGVVENGILISRFRKARFRDSKRLVLQGRRSIDITDGISKTIMLTESREEAYSSWYDAASTWVTPIRAFQSISKLEDGWYGPSESNSDDPALALNHGPGTADTRNHRYLRAGIGWNGAEDRSWGPSSEHGGSVVVHVMADATTIVLNEGIDPRVYYRLVTVDGGEMASIPTR